MPLTDNLISYWALDEASGTRVDKVGGNHLTDNNTVTQAAGLVYANSALFTVANLESLTRADNASLSTGGTPFTIIGWTYLTTNTGNAVIAAKDDQDTQREWVLYHIGSGVFEMITWTGSGTGLVQCDANAFGSPGPVNTWMMVAAVCDQVTSKISVNDGPQDSIAAPNAGWNGTGAFSIGANVGNYMDGRIGPVMFWKRALAPGEIQQVYNKGAGMTFETMVQGTRADYSNYPKPLFRVNSSNLSAQGRVI